MKLIISFKFISRLSSRGRVIRSVPALDGAAMAAILGWRFSPAVGRGGERVRVLIDVPFAFFLR